MVPFRANPVSARRTPRSIGQESVRLPTREQNRTHLSTPNNFCKSPASAHSAGVIFSMIRVLCCFAAVILAVPELEVSQQQPNTEADLRLAAAVAEFIASMKDANYPVLFDQRAPEFNF